MRLVPRGLGWRWGFDGHPRPTRGFDGCTAERCTPPQAPGGGHRTPKEPVRSKANEGRSSRVPSLLHFAPRGNSAQRSALASWLPIEMPLGQGPCTLRLIGVRPTTPRPFSRADSDEQVRVSGFVATDWAFPCAWLLCASSLLGGIHDFQGNLGKAVVTGELLGVSLYLAPDEAGYLGQFSQPISCPDEVSRR